MSYPNWKLLDDTGQRFSLAVSRILPANSTARNWLHALEERALDRSVAKQEGLQWERCLPCPYSLLDAGGAQVGQFLYVACGLRAPDRVSHKIFVFDLDREEWGKTIATPPELARSHCAVATDGRRFIYFASGQRGPHCSPAVDDVFSLDVQDESWRELPSLPQPRYAGGMRLWRGRLHFFGGAAEDRWTPKADHWSLPVEQGVATDGRWREEVPLPESGMHRGSAIVNDSLFVLGGQQGDFRPIAGDPDCKCTHKTSELYLKCVYRLDSPRDAWERMADMPVAASHFDSSTVVLDDTIYLLGGQIYKHPKSFYLRLTDAIQAFDTRANRWTVAGYLPCPVKTPVAGAVARRIYVTGGQRGAGDGDRPGTIIGSTWKAEIPESTPAVIEPIPIKSVRSRDILLITHELSRSGAPLLLLEAASAMIRSGANVRLATLDGGVKGRSLAADYRVPLIPIEDSIPCAREADLVLVNTFSDPAKAWVRECLKADGKVAERLAWWVHEIDREQFGADADLLARARIAIYDSHASAATWAKVVRRPKQQFVAHPALSDSFIAQTEWTRLPFPLAPGDYSSPTQQLSRDAMRERLGVGRDDFLVCNVGWYLPKKGQALLLRTLARAAAERGLPVKLLLVGFSALRRWAVLCSRTAAERRLLPASRAYVRQAHYSAFYRASDAFVMNSQGTNGRGENFGRVTIEAMAFGLPVLGAHAGGTPEIITDGVTGLLYPIGEQGQRTLVNCIERLVEDRQLASQLGNAGRKHALSYFREKRFGDHLNQALEEVLAPQALDS